MVATKEYSDTYDLFSSESDEQKTNRIIAPNPLCGYVRRQMVCPTIKELSQKENQSIEKRSNKITLLPQNICRK